MTTVNIGGRSLVTSPERDEYGRLRAKYRDIASEERRQFLANYSSQFLTADDLYQRLPDTINDLIRRLGETALADIAAHQIYDVDDEAFRTRLTTKDGLDAGYKQFQDDYLAIVLPAAQLEVERANRKAGRDGFVGGGFGVEGAARGMVLAAGANAALGLVRGIADQAGKAVATAGDKRKKQDLLIAEITRSRLGETIYQIAFAAHEVIAQIVNEHSDKPFYEPVRPEDQVRAKAILNNVVQSRVPADQQNTVLLDALQLDPFMPELWVEWLARFGDEDGLLARAAATVGIADIEAGKRALVEKEYKRLPKSTPDECLSSLAHLSAFAARLSTPAEAEVAALRSSAKRLDLEQRSHNGQTYETRQEAAVARAQEEERDARTYEGKLYDNVEEAAQAVRNATTLKEGRRRTGGDPDWVIAGIFPTSTIFLKEVYQNKSIIFLIVVSIGWLALFMSAGLISFLILAGGQFLLGNHIWKIRVRRHGT